MEYAELKCKTHYSFLRGASSPAELVDRAAELGLKAIAITDHDGVYGIPKAFAAARRHPGLKLITGAELRLDGLPRLTLLAMNRSGYGLMCRILTASHEGRPKGEAALAWPRFYDLMHSKGCDGLIAIPEEVPYPKDPALLRYHQTLKELFGDRLYLPISRQLDGHDKARTRAAIRLGRELGVALVAVNDVHCHAAERRNLQDALVSIRENLPLTKIGKRVFPNGERYLKSGAQMMELFEDLPEAIENTVKVAERCSFSPEELRYFYPSEWIPKGETAQGYLERLAWTGVEWRYPEGVPEGVRAQLEHELKLVEELRFADYFLTIWEIVEFAKSRKILCQGRGSAANSVICYCLGITAIDPVKMELLFERFISTERGEPPDIDVDFEHERREEVIQHIYEKYGRDRAGMVAAVITYRDRSIRRDLGKALGCGEEDERLQALGRDLKGFPRHLSIHSGGFTISADPMIETVPIEPARMEGRTIVQWDKEDLAAIGLVKVDVLALGMLTALRKTLDLIETPESGRKLTMATIPQDDPETYAMIQKADTVGTFQIESRAQMGMLGRLQPASFYDLVIQVAIVRPGPIVGNMVHPYLRRRRGEEPSESPLPQLNRILARTLGVPLFQEQVMKIAILLGDFTPGEADELRRAIGAWRSTGMIERLGERLQQGLLKSGLPREYVERLFAQIHGFAEYGFPESHAASFALLAYASSYLKCHYPVEFCCALLNSQPMGFYSPSTLVNDLKRHGARVLPVHPNCSDWDCRVEEDGALRMGWRVVNGLGEQDAERIVMERRKMPFRDLADFLARARLRPTVLHALAMGDAFRCFGLKQREALWQILAFWSFNRGDETARGQFDLFHGARHGTPHGEGREPASFAPLLEIEEIQADFRSYGLSTRGHPMQVLRKHKIKGIPPTTTGTIRRAPHGGAARLAGMVIVRQRPPTAKGTVFATIEDEEGFLDLILHEDVYEKYREVFVDHPFLLVSGKIQKDRETVNVIVKRLQALEPMKDLRVDRHDFH